MSDLRLIKVDINNNYQEPGDKLVLKTTWQNTGEEMPDFNAQIEVGISFCGRHRFDQSDCDFYNFKWIPFPATNLWRQGDIWTTTGIWTLPQMWGGSYEVSISLINENGERIPFFGSDSVPVYSQYITEIDVGWGWGRKRLLEQRKPVSVLISELMDAAPETECKTVDFNGYRLNTAYPSVCGCGDDTWYDFPSEFEVRRISDNKIFSFTAGKNAGFKFNLISSGRCEYTTETAYCSFTFSLSFCDGVLSARLCNVRENDDYELISFNVPSLVQCGDIGGSLVNHYGGGRKVNLSFAVPQTAVFPYDTCNALELCGDKNTFAVVTDDMDVILRQSVIKKNDESNTGIISACFVNKIKADEKNMKSIPVNMKPVEIHRISGNRWQFSAEILRNRLVKPCKYRYERTLVYKIGLDASGQNDPERPETFSPILTLQDVKNIIMKIHKLSGGMKQVVYLVGWQEGGHDFEYPKPYISGFNSACGTLEEFLKLREELKEFNVNLSFHDNFDDAYLSETYEINKDILSIDEKGNYWKGWLWAGGMSYIISPTAYLKSADIKERIQAVKEKYGIDGTYHLDVLSSEVRRYSFRENELSAAGDNSEAKSGIIDLFNKENIDVTSEILSMPFIGKIGYSQSTRYNFDSRLFIGEEVIPWTVLAFHGVTPYKMGANADKSSLLRSIAVGASCSIEIEKCGTDKEFEINLLRNICLTSIPMTELSYKKVLSAEYDGDKWRIEYEDDGLVETDFSKGTYIIKSAGKVISKNFETFLPVDKDSFLYYSLNGGVNELELPDDWERALLTSLSDDTRKIVNIENGRLKYPFGSDTPYSLSRLY